MAYHHVEYLQKVGAEGFAIIEKLHYGSRRNNNKQSNHAPPPQKLAPNQYQEPHDHQEANYSYAAAKYQPHAAYGPVAAAPKQGYETWYILPVPQAPAKEGIQIISSNEAAERYDGMIFVDYYGYKTTKTIYRRPYY
ncbi:hypothetical protein COLO4_13819 [Corchorus olitorius]|uniref:Uncharacterized protein n=1 Tax=Corchorus olitorius TaxID=93759 RepID=A0A1R3JUW1_9ROSI|nr:hypothetical protein COLO4_13819 [Corchorus olitorius]